MDWIPYGPNAVLIRFADKVGDESFQKSRAIVAELEIRPPQGLVEYVPAYTTMLLEFDPHETPDVPAVATDLVRRLRKASVQPAPPSRVVLIPVVYDGPDLERVAQLSKLTVAEVCQRHAQPVYKIFMLGFAPGFPYLGDLDPQLHTPRLPSPRPRVRAGSVAIGGEHTGIYSVDGPGGWNIIGHTSVTLFDPNKFQAGGDDEDAFYLRPGDQVQFIPTENATRPSHAAAVETPPMRKR